ncbi:response regulator transcription factor [Chitinophaga horti]|uniref:Response regulator transcription factor n=1 Tax=Chitinophaga horti TaxID=2920382 RepID=A0ABY6J6Y2_9BACT|nr:response regulator transcription factor [Chitinophaga horti]UYQ95438.1 response regulator transcription factor [Chitinophaga horti]
MSKTRLLLVEDEQVLATVIRETLELNGFNVALAGNGREGWELFRSFQPEICILDVMMPKKDGVSLLEEIRMTNEAVPVIFLTAKTGTDDVIRGLSAGADDYVKKPFSMEELLLRINALLKRSRSRVAVATGGGIYQIGAYRFDAHRQELRFEDQVQRLSEREAHILKILADHLNSVTARKAMLLKVWGDDGFFNARNMDVYITRIRKYLQQDSSVQIVNVRGVGYKLIA